MQYELAKYRYGFPIGHTDKMDLWEFQNYHKILVEEENKPSKPKR